MLDDGGDQQWMPMPTRHETDRRLISTGSPRVFHLLHVRPDAEGRVLWRHAQPDNPFRQALSQLGVGFPDKGCQCRNPT